MRRCDALQGVRRRLPTRLRESNLRRHRRRRTCCRSCPPARRFHRTSRPSRRRTGCPSRPWTRGAAHPEVVPTDSVESVMFAVEDDWRFSARAGGDASSEPVAAQAFLNQGGGPSHHHNGHRHHRSASVTVGAGSSHRHYKYCKPPTLPNAKNPNHPMVSRTSKKIHKKHVRYA